MEILKKKVKAAGLKMDQDNAKVLIVLYYNITEYIGEPIVRKKIYTFQNIRTL